MALRRAHADEYAVRVNRAVELLAELSPADAVRGLQAESGLSERQARRYVDAAPERRRMTRNEESDSERQRQRLDDGEAVRTSGCDLRAGVLGQAASRADDPQPDRRAA